MITSSGTVLGSILSDYIHKELDDAARNKVKKDYRSIARQSTQGICQFPLIVSRSLDYDTLTIINKACERGFSSFLQVVLQMNQVMGEKETVADFVRRFHSNDQDVVRTESINSIMRENRIMMVTFESMFETTKLNCKYNAINPRTMYMTEASNGNGAKVKGSKGSIGRRFPTPTGKNTSTIKGGDMVPKDSLMDNDVKKSNEMVPTLLHIKVKQALSSGVTDIDFILGVKATTHPVASNDMIHNLIKVITKKTGFFDFLRWTSGEISLFKDIILGLGEAKTRLRDQYDKKSSAWWNLLQNKKTISSYNKWTRSTPILPNATIVISQEESDYLKAVAKFDILEPDNARKLISELGLIQLVVVDVSTELAHFMIDGQREYQIYTFSALERENGNSEKQFKNILKAVNKL